MEFLIRRVGIEALAFASEANGAFPGVQSEETGHDADDVQRYLQPLQEGLGLSEKQMARLFEGNARAFFANLDHWFPVTA